LRTSNTLQEAGQTRSFTPTSKEMAITLKEEQAIISELSARRKGTPRTGHP